jgi:O-succinylbenzoic acid--CoA ligase
MTLIKHCPIAQFAKTDPSAPAIDLGSEIITYAHLHQLISDTAHTLSQIKEDIIQWTPTTHLEDIIVFWACLRSQKIAFPTNSKIPSQQLSTYISQSHAISVSPQALGKTAVKTPSHQSQTLNLGQIATYLLTSGTSGPPKIAVHTLGNYIINASGTLYNIPLIAQDRWLLNLPLFHVGGIGILMRCFLSRATIVLPSPTPNTISHLSVVPTQLRHLLDTSPDRLTHLQAILIGGAKCPQHLIDKALTLNLPIHTTYGLTEMTSQVTTTPPKALASDLSTSGQVLCDRDLCIAQDGEIWVKGPCLFQGYLLPNNIPYEKTTKLPLTENGWFQTGDIGHLDRHDNLIVTGRKDRLIISGGENIHPEEIEAILVSIKEIKSAVIKSIKDDKWGHRPIAYIEADLSDPLLKTIEITLNQSLPKYKHPDKILPISLIDKTWKQ